jgi:hypothetical protein
MAGPLSRPGIGERREKNYRNSSSPFYGFQAPTDFDAVHAGQGNIEDDGLRDTGERFLESLRSVARGDNVHALSGQRFEVQLQIILCVVNEQHLGSVIGHGRVLIQHDTTAVAR